MNVPAGYVALRVPPSHRGRDKVQRLVGERALYCAAGGSFDRIEVIIAPAADEPGLRAIGCTRPRVLGDLWLWWASDPKANEWHSRERALAIGALPPSSPTDYADGLNERTRG